jgi:MFS superfamily sulfate permease-like transporter
VSLDDIGRLIPVAAGIALVGFTDNLLTARSVAGRDRVEPNQELLALGLINLSAGLSRGFPISSSASRTAVPASMGTRTQAVSLVAAAFVVATLLFLHPLLGEVPRAALAAVIVAAGLAIIDVAGFRSLWRISRPEAATAAVAVLGVVVFDVLVGVVVAVVTSGLVALYRVARPHDAVLGDLAGLDGWVDVDAYPDATTEPGLLVYRFDAPLFFVNVDHFCARVTEVLADNPGREDWLVLDCEGIGSLDATALDALAGLLEQVHDLGVHVTAVARANDAVLAGLEAAGLLDPPGPTRSFPTINSAVRAFRDHGER